MSGVESKAKPELVKNQEGGLVFKNLPRNPPEVKEKLIKEFHEQREKLHRK